MTAPSADRAWHGPSLGRWGPLLAAFSALLAAGCAVFSHGAYWVESRRAGTRAVAAEAPLSPP
ncbi:MAG: hypothetical protein WBE06_05735, partial [Phycisphaerae bacterium]